MKSYLNEEIPSFPTCICMQSLVTPLGALFWTLFDDPSCGEFKWFPHTDATVYFSIGGIVLMAPAIFFYNIGYICNIDCMIRLCTVECIVSYIDRVNVHVLTINYNIMVSYIL